MSIYDFQVKAQDGSEVSLADYKGKVLLIVNTATGCGFTPSMTRCRISTTPTRRTGWRSWISPATSLASTPPAATRRDRSSPALNPPPP